MENSVSSKLLMNVLNGSVEAKPPLWMMRQAGRYLEEYRKVRTKAGSFLNLCYTPSLATEVTLQPIRRFGFDAAILFSDILVICDALGQEVTFKENHGPKLAPLDEAGLARLSIDRVPDHVAPVLETIDRLRTALPQETTLLGFCGAPWTVATYMIEGGGSSDHAKTRLCAIQNPRFFDVLIDLLVEASSRYLVAQLKAGADAVQVFDTWSGVLGEVGFEKYAIAPMKAIVENVRSEVHDAKIIGFPRGAGIRYKDYVERTGVSAVSLDWSVPKAWAHRELQTKVAVQGNLDPMTLLAGGAALDQEIDDILNAFTSGRFIFNLGHGITPKTPVTHVEQLVQRVRAYTP